MDTLFGLEYGCAVMLFFIFGDNMFNFTFFFSSFLIGIGLAMDAFSVSLANGLNEPDMSVKKSLGVAGIFGFFQGLMPFIGWFLVTQLTSVFNWLEPIIPWVALGLLGFIGGKMLYEGIKEYKCREGGGGDECPVPQKLTFTSLLVQGFATSIDALSGGTTMKDYSWLEAAVCAFIVAVITFGLCFAGVFIGKKSGTALASKSAIFGGSILIFIGIWIFVKSIFGIDFL